MALTKCKECDNDVSTKAYSCPKCGAKLNGQGSRMGCGFLLLILFIVAVFASVFHEPGNTPPPSPSSSTPPPTSSASAAVDFQQIEHAAEGLLASGIVIKVNADLNEAYVSTTLWNATDVEEKTTLGYILAYYCGHKKGTNLYWVEIKDYNSGKRLMKWSKAWGCTFD